MNFTIRDATAEDFQGVRDLLAQMPEWHVALGTKFIMENLVAVDDFGSIVGWLNGDHHSASWQAIDDYEMPRGWRCSYIGWLLVDEGCRENNIGHDLVEYFARESSAAGRDTIVASPQAGSDEHKLLQFYSDLGFRRAASGHVHWGPYGPQENVPLTTHEVDADYLRELGRYR